MASFPTFFLESQRACSVQSTGCLKELQSSNHFGTVTSLVIPDGPIQRLVPASENRMSAFMPRVLPDKKGVMECRMRRKTETVGNGTIDEAS